jgi:hypothetical protein
MGCISSPKRSAVRAMKSVGDSSSGLLVAQRSPRTSFSWFRRSADTKEGIWNTIEAEGRKKWYGEGTAGPGEASTPHTLFSTHLSGSVASSSSSVEKQLSGSCRKEVTKG